MKRTVALVLLIGGLSVMLFGCKKKTPPAVPTAAADSPVTGLRFTYDNFSGVQFYLTAYAQDLNGSEARVEMTKRVGPMNAYGREKEGELTEILGRYDLAAWSKLPTSGSGSSPSRSLIVFSGEAKLYDVAWNAKFPQTLPPQEDVMYAELYNFFNDLISAAPGWEDVRSDNLEDPRENPAYAERTVTWFGQSVRLVPGTGVGYADGRYAELDYGEKRWWTEEGFTGTWTPDPDRPAEGPNAPRSVSLTVREDGTVTFTQDGETWDGSVAAIRRYMDDAGLSLERGYERRACTVALTEPEDYGHIHLFCYPGPVPEPQFAPIDVYLVRDGEK